MTPAGVLGARHRRARRPAHPRVDVRLRGGRGPRHLVPAPRQLLAEAPAAGSLLAPAAARGGPAVGSSAGRRAAAVRPGDVRGGAGGLAVRGSRGLRHDRPGCGVRGVLGGVAVPVGGVRGRVAPAQPLGDAGVGRRVGASPVLRSRPGAPALAPRPGAQRLVGRGDGALLRRPRTGSPQPPGDAHPRHRHRRLLGADAGRGVTLGARVAAPERGFRRGVPPHRHHGGPLRGRAGTPGRPAPGRGTGEPADDAAAHLRAAADARHHELRRHLPHRVVGRPAGPAHRLGDRGFRCLRAAAVRGRLRGAVHRGDGGGRRADPHAAAADADRLRSVHRADRLRLPHRPLLLAGRLRGPELPGAAVAPLRWHGGPVRHGPLRRELPADLHRGDRPRPGPHDGGRPPGGRGPGARQGGAAVLGRGRRCDPSTGCW